MIGNKNKTENNMDWLQNKTTQFIALMGIVGTLERVEKETVILKMIDGAKIEFMTSAISNVQSADDVKEASTEPQTKGVS